MRTKQIILAVVWLIIGIASGDCQLLTYNILPGSTIYATAGATQTGPTEALTGTFQFNVVQGTFEAVSLNLSSPSYSLSLASPTYMMFNVDPNNIITVFQGIVNMNGFSINKGIMGNFLVNPEYYNGPAAAPTFLDLQGLTIGPLGGGYFAADLSFTAALEVPDESSTALLFSLAVMLCLPFGWYCFWKNQGRVIALR